MLAAEVYDHKMEISPLLTKEESMNKKNSVLTRVSRRLLVSI